jgi:hypothetical protein
MPTSPVVARQAQRARSPQKHRHGFGPVAARFVEDAPNRTYLRGPQSSYPPSPVSGEPCGTREACPCPANATRGRIEGVCEGAQPRATASVPGLTQAALRSPGTDLSLSPELAPGAPRAVGERYCRILTTEVDAPTLARLDPRTPTLEAAERDQCDRAFAVFLLHRRGSGVETRAVSNR